MAEPAAHPRRVLCDTALGVVHYVDSGGPGVPFVLLHQTPRSIDEFRDVVPVLGRSRRVIAIDTPGYGCSDHPAEPPAIADYAGAVVQVLDHAGVAQAIVAGHHTGAVIAVELAASVPHRVAGVALSGPVYLDAGTRQALSAHFAQWRVQADGAHLIDKWRKFLSWTSDPALAQRLVVDLFRAGETSEFGHFAVGEYHMEDRLPRCSGPALLIYGSRDPFASIRQRDVFCRAFDVRGAVTIEAGVFLPSEAPAAFAGALVQHFA